MAVTAETVEVAKVESTPIFDATKPGWPEEFEARGHHDEWFSDKNTYADVGDLPVTGTGDQGKSLDEGQNGTRIPCDRGTFERNLIRLGVLRKQDPDAVINGPGETEINEDGKARDAENPPRFSGPRSKRRFLNPASRKGKGKAVAFNEEVKTAYQESDINEELLSFTYTAQTPGSFRIDDSNETGTNRLTLRRPTREKNRSFEKPFTLARYLNEVRQLYPTHSRTPDGPLDDLTTAVFLMEPDGPVVLQHISSAHETRPAIASIPADYAAAIFDRLVQDEALIVIRLFVSML